MNKQFDLFLHDSLLHYRGRQLEKALHSAQLALSLAADSEGTGKGSAHVCTLLANICNIAGKYRHDAAFFEQANSYLEQAKSWNQGEYASENAIEITLTQGKIQLNNRDYDGSAMHFQKALDLAREHGYLALVAAACTEVGQLAMAQNDPKETLESARQVEQLLPRLPAVDQDWARAGMYQLFSQAYILQQQYPEALEASQALLALSRQLGDAEKEVAAIRNIGVVSGVESDYKLAMQYFLEAMDKCEAIGYQEWCMQLQINIGTLYAHLYNFDEAIRRYENVLEQHPDLVDAKAKTVVLNNLGNIYLTSEQPGKAIGYFEKANRLAHENDFHDLTAYSLAQLGRTKVALSQFDEAMADATAAQRIFEAYALTSGKQINLLNLAQLAFEQQHNDEARHLATQAVALAQLLKDDTTEIKGYKLLSLVFKRQGEFEKALAYQERYAEIQAEFAKLQRNRYYLDMEIQHAIREKQKEIQLLTQENEYQAQLLEKSEHILRQNQALMQVNDDLRQFAYIASHDLKEPLRMIGSFTQVIEKLAQPHLSVADLDYFQYVKEGVDRMNSLLDGLLKYSTVNQPHQESSEVALNEIFKLTMANLKIRIMETGAVIEQEELPVVRGTPQLFVQLFQNLISNAIKFVRPGTPPSIVVTATETPAANVIHVTDNGIGISPANQDKIFEIFKRLHHQSEYEGTGIGLAICLKIVKRMGGTIHVQSELGQGSTFSVVLPKKGGK